MVVKREALSDRVFDPANMQDAAQELDTGVALSGRSFTQDFVLTDELDQLCGRALRYLGARIPIHFRGRAGCGKTALSLFLAHELGRKVYFLNGDAMRDTASLIGQETGVRTRQVLDRYVHSVHKLERETSINWRDDVLTQAALGGGTLVYDEFTRSPAEANNALLSVLEEGILVLPAAAGKGSFAPVHDDFRVIFTSNSLEYAGVQAPQDALIDRMITFDLDDLTLETETAIVSHRTALEDEQAARIVALVRDFRTSGTAIQMPTMRASLMIAEVVRRAGLSVSADDAEFCDLVCDVLSSKAQDAQKSGAEAPIRAALLDTVKRHCAASAQAGR
ncbi:MAG: gas vesicle protein GvpN [Pseudomonadota bacterium]